MKYALTLVQVAGEADVEIESHETTGEDDFKYKKSPAVCAVIINKSSRRRYAQITGRDKAPEVIHTDNRESGFKKAKIEVSQSYILYGRPTVLYIRSR